MSNIVSIDIVEVTNYSDAIALNIRALVKQLDNDFQPLTEQDFKKIITSSCTHLFLARLSDTEQVVGMATLVAYRIPYKMKGILEDIVVDSKYRKQGIGKRLLLHVINSARELGVRSLDLTSRPEREDANTLYQKVGFEKRNTNIYRLIIK